jgi:hypothetical protein
MRSPWLCHRVRRLSHTEARGAARPARCTPQSTGGRSIHPRRNRIHALRDRPTVVAWWPIDHARAGRITDEYLRPTVENRSPRLRSITTTPAPHPIAVARRPTAVSAGATARLGRALRNLAGAPRIWADEPRACPCDACLARGPSPHHLAPPGGERSARLRAGRGGPRIGRVPPLSLPLSPQTVRRRGEGKRSTLVPDGMPLSLWPLAHPPTPTPTGSPTATGWPRRSRSPTPRIPAIIRFPGRRNFSAGSGLAPILWMG